MCFFQKIGTMLPGVSQQVTDCKIMKPQSVGLSENLFFAELMSRGLYEMVKILKESSIGRSLKKI